MKTASVIFMIVFTQLMLQPLSFIISRKKRISTKEDADFWNKLGTEELHEALNQHVQLGVAKNIVLFIGDGLSISTLTAARIYKGQKEGRPGEEGYFSFERFPHLALIKPYSVNKQVADSASTATAIFSGVKANYKTLGLDANAVYKDCDASLGAKKLDTILKWAQDEGKDTGFVTTARVTHATPAALYGHTANRYWECDGDMTAAEKNCVDLGRQLVEQEPGKSIKVILGGGRQSLMADPPHTEADPLDDWACKRNDGKNLISIWQADKEEKGFTARYVTNTRDLNRVDIEKTDYLLGIFSNDHLPYEDLRDKSEYGCPHIANMTRKALEMLQKNNKGYFLMVEGAKIDIAHHSSWARRSLEETVAFDQAVRVALEMTDNKDTLIIVTSDHSHTMTISGYPERGSNILGTAGISNIDLLPYTTLMYANGQGYHFLVTGDSVTRRNLTGQDTSGWNFVSLSAVPQPRETHAGDDVGLYATGPMAHLFHRVHEQNYIAHVMSYASCVGPHKDICPKDGSSSAATGGHVTRLWPLMLFVLVVMEL